MRTSFFALDGAGRKSFAACVSDQWYIFIDDKLPPDLKIEHCAQQYAHILLGHEGLLSPEQVSEGHNLATHILARNPSLCFCPGSACFNLMDRKALSTTARDKCFRPAGQSSSQEVIGE